MLSGDTRLEVADDVTRPLTAAALEITLAGVRMEHPRSGLPVLRYFIEPLTLVSLEARWQDASSPARRLSCLALVRQLFRHRMLVDADADPNSELSTAQPAVSYDLLLRHRAMLADATRALRPRVTPNDVVLDIGSGVLATAASDAGTAQVYALEGGPFSAVAKRVFDAHPSSRISLLSQWSTSTA
ncbi:MAG: hypothetical protein ACI8PT_002470 [Gammaproteobacteria bacterium]